MDKLDEVLQKLLDENGYIDDDGEHISLKRPNGSNIEFDQGYERPVLWRPSRGFFDGLKRDGYIFSDVDGFYRLTPKGEKQADKIELKKMY